MTNLTEAYEKGDGPLAREIRIAYVEHKSHLLHINYKLPTRFQSSEIWLKAAGACKEVGCAGLEFIRLVFQLCPMQGQGPMPTQLYCQQVRDRLRTYKQPEKLPTASGNPDDDFDFALKGQFNTLISLAFSIDPRKERTLTVLRDRTSPLEAWFRIILGWCDPITWHHYGYDANQFLRTHPGMTMFLQRRNYPIAAIMSQFNNAPAPQNPWPPAYL